MPGPSVDGEVVWQVEYNDLVGEAASMWWDLPKVINDFIEQERKAGREIIEYHWPWEYKGRVRYLLDTNTKEVLNTQTGHKRKVRRVLILSIR